jgi:hypothetical protein
MNGTIFCLYQSNLVINRSKISDNHGSNFGGALYFNTFNYSSNQFSSNKLEINNCNFTNNSAKINGMNIWNEASDFPKFNPEINREMNKTI